MTAWLRHSDLLNTITHLLISICDKVDKLNMTFLWEHSEEKSKVHLVKWEKVCMPQFIGRLGLKETYVMNQALFAKLVGNLCKGLKPLGSSFTGKISHTARHDKCLLCQVP